jgi:UDP-glucose 4-epimerase
MRILLTGGSGDLGQLLAEDLKSSGYTPVVLDVRPPRDASIEFIEGSILDRELLKTAVKNIDCIVHIAAWHGIHENQKQKTPEEFHDLNVTGTFNVFEAAAKAGIKKISFVSSTSVDDRYGLYAHTKILGEEMARAYAHRHDMDIIILRPRAFIPPWNTTVYKSYIEWANWFVKGSVHVRDVSTATLKSVERLFSGPLPEKAPICVIDGAYEYTAQDLKDWDKDGPGITFKKTYPEFYDLAKGAGINIARKPFILDISKTQELLGYAPEFSLKTLLEDLRIHGLNGPPAPFDAPAKTKPPAPKM